MRSGALAVPESFAVPCPWCRGGLVAEGRCSRCGGKLKCEGFGEVHTRAGHGMTCGEVACDLRYLPAAFDWQRVIDAYARRGEPLDWRDA